MREIPREWLDFLREQFPAGSRIKLREMKDPYANQRMKRMGLSAAEHGFVSWNGTELNFEYSQPEMQPTMSM